jgi:hypothetical protein
VLRCGAGIYYACCRETLGLENPIRAVRQHRAKRIDGRWGVDS